MTELQLQAQCFQWHWNTFPEERQMLFHVQQKAKNAIEGSTFKAIGVVKGISDLLYIHFTGVDFLELKTESGAQRPDQKTFEAKVRARGHRYVIIRSLAEFKKHIYDRREKNA